VSTIQDERPIRPQADYKAADEYIGMNEEEANGGNVGPVGDAPIFPEGEHPLDGVPNFETLPGPEPLGKTK
jgi:hypothetical protein